MLHVRRKLTPRPAGFVQEFTLEGVARRSEGASASAVCTRTSRVESRETRAKRTSGSRRSALDSRLGRTLRLGDRFASRIVLMEPAEAKLAEDGKHLLLSADKEERSPPVAALPESEVPIDRFPAVPQPPAAVRKGEPVEVAPGFHGERLPAAAGHHADADWPGGRTDGWSFPR